MNTDNLIKIYSDSLKSFLKEQEINSIMPQVEASKNLLLSKKGDGNDYLGWIDLPVNYDKIEFENIKLAAKKIINDSDILIVIGIGGSYLGAKAAIEFLRHPFYNNLDKDKRKTPQIYFAGQNMSSDYINGLIDLIDKKDFSINVISKSGTTTEPAVAFRIFKELLEKKYGKEEAAKRIYATTDKSKGALKTLADKENYQTFVIPDDVGGRFSVLTAVGLLPIAVSGADIDSLIKGATDERNRAISSPFYENPEMLYAAYRNLLLRKGKSVEILVGYDPAMHYISEWWKQLYGESEGKDLKGIFPSSVDFTTDLHSMGQFIQDGARVMFETVISIAKSNTELILKNDEKNIDGLNYIAGKDLDFINQKAMQGTILAHSDGNVPNIVINMPCKSEYTLGSLFYFFEFACAISGYMLGVNPFNQPGVEAYKQNMFALLGKEGYEIRANKLLEKS